MKNVLIVCSGLRAHAVLYYRAISPATFLNANKYANVKFLTSFPNNYGRINLLAFSWADTIITQRFYHNGPFLAPLREGYKRFKGLKIYETDDLVWDVPFKPIRKAYNETKDFTEQLIREADIITCTTEYLKQQILKKRQRCRVDVIPNSVDNGMWLWERPYYSRIRILYAASGTHYKEVKFIKKILRPLRKKYGTKIETILLSPYFKEKKDKIWDHVYQFVPFKNFPEFMTGLAPDIGLAPIVDKTPFNLSKSSLKFLDFTMSGAASIVEDCACFDDVDSPIKATGIKEWRDAIEKLLDKKTRDKYIKEANKEISKKFLIHDNVDLWKNALKKN